MDATGTINPADLNALGKIMSRRVAIHILLPCRIAFLPKHYHSIARPSSH